jgi:hypothetical protein
MAAIPGKSIVQAAVTTTETVVVDVDFTSASVSGSTITNNAPGRFANLTQVGATTGINTTDGINYLNTSLSSAQYLTGNLGSTASMSKIVIEFTAKFPDAGCARQSTGSMVFGLGSSSSIYVPYNIYRHSNFIGFNTFASDIYGVQIPDLTSFNSYKMVMVPNTAAKTTQEIYINGVSQSLAYRTTGSGSNGCSSIGGVDEAPTSRIFTNGGYSNGDFMFMTHPLGADTWRTSGEVKNLKITTTSLISTPTAPTISSVTPGSQQVSVAFTAPTSNGGGTITGYKYSTDNGATWSTSAVRNSPFVVTGLTNGASYTLKLLAVNSAGDGAVSNAASATPAGAPSAPAITSVTPSDQQVAVAFTAPTSDGGSAITGYKYSTDNGATWSTSAVRSSPFTIAGLTNGSTYTIKLLAENTVGDGAESSGSIVIAGVVAPPTQEPTPTPTPVVETIAPAPTSATTATPTPSATPKPKSSASASPKQTDNPESIESPTPEPTPIESAESQPNPLATDESFNIDSASEKELNSSDNRPLFAFLVFGTLVFLLLIVKRSRKKN